MNPSHELLRRLAANDEASLRLVLRPTPEFTQSASTPEDSGQPSMPQLDRHTRVLVRLAALLAIGAPTASLRWAVELASATGAGDDALAAVLVSTAAEAGGAQISSSASRLALALGFDLELDGSDGAY